MCHQFFFEALVLHGFGGKDFPTTTTFWRALVAEAILQSGKPVASGLPRYVLCPASPLLGSVTALLPLAGAIAEEVLLTTIGLLKSLHVEDLAQTAQPGILLDTPAFLLQGRSALLVSDMGCEFVGDALCTNPRRIARDALVLVVEAIAHVAAKLARLPCERIGAITKIARRVLGVTAVDLHVNPGDNKIGIDTLRVVAIKVRSTLG